MNRPTLFLLIGLFMVTRSFPNESTLAPAQMLDNFDKECKALVDSWRLPTGAVILTFEHHAEVVKLDSFKVLITSKHTDLDLALAKAIQNENSSPFLSFVVCRREGWNWEDMLRGRARTFRLLRELTIAKIGKRTASGGKQ